MPFKIVAKAFTPQDFHDYVTHIDLSAWKPSMVVDHNTASPTLAQRKNGFSAQGMLDLQQYYAITQGWSGGPHLFVDQNEAGIWVFNPLDDPGIHSPSWNGVAWGVEMLGDYSVESFDAGPGLRVQKNAVSAIASMFCRLGLTPDDDHFKLHKEDPRTTHKGCPGGNVRKESMRSQIIAQMALLRASAGIPAKVVIYLKGRGADPVILDATIVNGATMVDAAQWNRSVPGAIVKGTGPMPVRTLAGDRFMVNYVQETSRVYLAEKG